MSLTICDDHPLFAQSLATALTARGHEVLAVTATPDELFEQLSKAPSDVLLDVNLAESSGLDVAGEIRTRLPGTLVILLTGAEAAEVWGAVDAGLVDGAVSKNCDISVISSVIRAVRSGKRVVEGWSRPIVPRQSGAARPPSLTRREREILQFLLEGASTAEMARQMGLSTNTVRSHVQNLLRKLGVHGRGKAASLAAAYGIGARSRTGDSAPASA
jgi:DNA-binding NarL/FixJ family response regulator